MNENTVGAKKISRPHRTLTVDKFEKEGRIVLNEEIDERNWNTVFIKKDDTFIMDEGHSDIPGNDMERQKFKKSQGPEISGEALGQNGLWLNLTRNAMPGYIGFS